MPRRALASRLALALAAPLLALSVVGSLGAGAVLAQDDPTEEAVAISPVDAMQIGEVTAKPSPLPQAAPQPSAYLDQSPDDTRPRSQQSPAGSPPPDLDQVSPRGDTNVAPATQISAPGGNDPQLPQLSGVELDASLAQLSPAERMVLLEAIEGSDICDNPPDAPAIIALCRTRIETRSDEFGAAKARELSAEEQLISNNPQGTAAPSLAQVVDRLSRTRVSSEDFSNQAIASVALGVGPAANPEPAPEDNPTGLEGLAPGTQELINAIVNQLTGGAGGGG